MEGFSVLLEFVKPVKLTDIVLDVSETAEDFVVFRVHCKYDTQATGDEIVEKLKALDKLNEGVLSLDKELGRIAKMRVKKSQKLSEEDQIRLKYYLEGLLRARYLLKCPDAYSE